VRVVLAFLSLFLIVRPRFLRAGGHVLEPVPFDAAEVEEHPGHRPAGRHGRRLPGLLGQPLDRLQHRGALELQEAQERARLVVGVDIAGYRRSRQWNGLGITHHAAFRLVCHSYDGDGTEISSPTAVTGHNRKDGPRR